MAGCFSFLKKPAPPARELVEKPPSAHRSHSTKSSNWADADYTPRLPEAHEHYEPCFQCSDALSRMTLDKMGLDADLPAYSEREPFSKDVRATIRKAVEHAAPALTKLSLYLSDHPELGFHEVKAHEHITAYLEDAGFKVERGYKDLPTAFRASYKRGSGRTFGFNSEYDALPGVGHACGHNLIAVSGVAAAVGVMAALKAGEVEGEVVLIGTPAEEGGVGKGILLERGGYHGLEACMMIHPTGMESGISGIVPTLAITTITVEFFGKTSHAGGAPWDGINALDAVNIAYSSISAMRQQMHTTDRVHGIITKGGDAPNIIPDHTAMKFFVRAQSAKGVDTLVDRVKACFEGAATATGCKVKYNVERMMYDLRNNLPIAEEYAAAMGEEYNLPVKVAIDDWSMSGGSTDFGNVTYAMPAVHPMYGVPSTPGRANHTIEFRNACRTEEAHALTYKFAAGMACVAARFMSDGKFAKEVKAWYDDNTKDK